MVDLGSEEHLGRHHWVLVRQEQFSVEEASLVGSVVRTLDLHVEMSEVNVVRCSVDANHRICSQSLCFLRRVRGREWKTYFFDSRGDHEN